MKTKDHIANEDADVLRAVQMLIERGYSQEIAERVAAMAIPKNEILNDISWRRAR